MKTKTKPALKIPPTPAPAAIPQPASPPQIEQAPIRVEVIPLGDIEFGPNIRDRRSISTEAVDAMAQSILHQGLANPITVMAGDDGRYTLVCGQLRVLGAMRAGLEGLKARIVPPLDPDQVRDLQAAENLQREAFGLVEEAQLCRSVYEQEGGGAEGLDRAVLARVAQRLGRTPRWCNERLRVGRLDPTVLHLIVAGRVTHAQALLIAQVADPKHQQKLAEECNRGWYWGSALPLEDLAARVNRVRNSLTVIPWSPDAKLAGVDAPACRDCPHNSANDTDLFAVIPEAMDHRGVEHPREQVEEGPAWCRKQACYDAKTKWANKEAQKAAAKVVKVVERDTALSTKALPKQLEVAQGLIETAAPAGVSVERVREQVKEQLSAKRESATVAAKAATHVNDDSERRWKEQQARAEKTRKAVKAWVIGIERQMQEAFRAQPLRAVVYRILEQGSARGGLRAIRSWRADDRKKAKLSPKAAQWFEVLRNPTPETVADLAVQAWPLSNLIDDTLAGQRAWNESSIEALRQVLCLTIPPKPTAASIAKEERAKAKAKAGKKPVAASADADGEDE